MNKYDTSRSYGVTLGKSLIISFITTLILFLIFTVVLTYTKMSEGMIPIIDSIILIVSITLGAIYKSINSEKRGFLNGGIVGLIYILLLILISSIFMKNFQFTSYTLTKIFIGILTGVVAGMIGVNLK